MSAGSTTRDEPVLRAARTATGVAFAGAGFAFASWAARIPDARDLLGLSASRLGVVLLALAVGSVLGVLVAGPLVARAGARRTVAGAAVLLAAGLATAGLGTVTGVPVLVAGLAVAGVASGAWDVAMNVHGALVEQRLGRSVMPRFHAGFSVGTVAGAVGGAAMAGLGVPVAVHLGAVALLVGVAVPVATRSFVTASRPSGGGRPRPDALAAWREPRTLVLGVVVLAFAFVEGAGHDWISVAAVDGYDLSPAAGASVYAVFLTAMTGTRWLGTALLDRFGRVTAVRVLALVGAAGALLFVLAPSVPLACAGVLLWGVGTALGFPVGMSAAADDPSDAAARVGVVSSIGYCAFLAGPPLLGVLGDRLTVLQALVVVAALLGVAAALAPALRTARS